MGFRRAANQDNTAESTAGGQLGFWATLKGILGAIGVIGALALTGQTINVVALIGAVMLAGIVVNNAIVLVDAVNRRRRDHGESTFDALVEAGRQRLRPILMTSATTIFGLLPMALGLGEGAELRAPLAITSRS